MDVRQIRSRRHGPLSFQIDVDAASVLGLIWIRCGLLGDLPVAFRDAQAEVRAKAVLDLARFPSSGAVFAATLMAGTPQSLVGGGSCQDRGAFLTSRAVQG